MMAVMGVGLTALESKDMTLCGEKNVFGDYCRMPLYYLNSKDESLRDVACGMCGSEIDCQGFIMNVNFCHECKEERNSILQFCMRHSPADQLQKKEKLQ
jgi:hypothetical protein